MHMLILPIPRSSGSAQAVSPTSIVQQTDIGSQDVRKNPKLSPDSKAAKSHGGKLTADATILHWCFCQTFHQRRHVPYSLQPLFPGQKNQNNEIEMPWQN